MINQVCVCVCHWTCNRGECTQTLGTPGSAVTCVYAGSKSPGAPSPLPPPYPSPHIHVCKHLSTHGESAVSLYPTQTPMPILTSTNFIACISPHNVYCLLEVFSQLGCWCICYYIARFISRGQGGWSINNSSGAVTVFSWCHQCSCPVVTVIL